MIDRTVKRASAPWRSIARLRRYPPTRTPDVPSPQFEAFCTARRELTEWAEALTPSGIQLLVGFAIGDQFAKTTSAYCASSGTSEYPAYRQELDTLSQAIFVRLRAVDPADRLVGIAHLHNAVFAPHHTARILCARAAQQTGLGEWTEEQRECTAPLAGIEKLTTLGARDAATAAAAVLTWEGSAELLALALSLPDPTP